MKTSSIKNRDGFRKYKQAKTPEEYLNQRMVRSGDCWIFTGGLDRDGYGQVQATYSAKKLKCTRAHQMSYLTWKGEYDRNLFICHTCHNPTCINPNHLYAGTALQNNQDMMREGRQRFPKGEESSNHKLSWEEVERLRRLKGKYSCSVVAKWYGISFGHVCRIWRGERYVSKK